MPPKKKTEGDEAQATAPDPSEAAKAAREAFHEANGRTDHKDWDDLSPEKQQRWLDEAAAQAS